ncbi:unnamed protein product [Adineta steineri]|uniref:Kinesin light chain n=1 Tax=Adineta steineri TaxID=433720 RepID=A0A813UEX9_9BILA|nr:unnamed protein product [Adineta steineri]
MSDKINVDTISLVCLDGSAYDAGEDNIEKQQLRLLDKNLRIYNDKNKCEEYIRAQSEPVEITLIVNGSLGQQIVPDVHQLTHIIDIYVYCMKKDEHEKWAKQYDKIRGVFVDFDSLYKQLQPNPTVRHANHALIEKTSISTVLETELSATTPSKMDLSNEVRTQTDVLPDTSSDKEMPDTTATQPEMPTTTPSQADTSSDKEMSDTTKIHSEMPTTTPSQADTSSDKEMSDATGTQPEMTITTPPQADTSSDMEMPDTNATQPEISTTTPSQADTVSTALPQINNSYALDISYMISDSCFECITSMKLNSADKDDFISLCQHIMNGNDTILALIQEFSVSYSPDKAISWLYKNQFFCGYLEYIFINCQIDSILYCRVFIHDIYKQLEQNKCTSSIRVYRCEEMSNEKFEQLKTFNGKTIAPKYFFLTNSNRETIVSYMSNYPSANECKHILFIIDADPEISNIKPFAKIGSLSDFNDPNDVLFMIGSLFKITSIEETQDGIVNIEMKLCANDDDGSDNGLKAAFDNIKDQCFDNCAETNVISFGKLCFGIGTSLGDTSMCDVGESYIRDCLKRLPDNHPDQFQCHNALGLVELTKNNTEASLTSFRNALNIKIQTSLINDSSLVQTHNYLAVAYSKKEDFTNSLHHFKQVLTIRKQSDGDDHMNLVLCHINIAFEYDKQNNFLEAFSHYSQAEMIMMKHNAINEPTYANICNGLAKIRTHLTQYQLALGYYETSLQIMLRFVSRIHPDIALTYKKIGLVYQKMGNLQQCRIELEKAAKIYGETQSPDNSNVTDIEELIRNLPSEPILS